MTFAGQVALITGAASGIGRAVTQQFCIEDGSALLVDIDADGGHALRAELVAAGSVVDFVHTDVGNVEAIRTAVATTVERFGRLDVVFHAAGVVLARNAESTTEAEWQRILDVNLKSSFFLAAAAMPYLRAHAGTIVFVASMAGMGGQAGTPAYCASKGGLIALTRALAIDHAADGVRINCVCPGSVDTPMMHRWLEEQPDPAGARKALVERQPLGRMATPDNVAAAMLFLASPAASFITGEALTVDGGLFMGPR